MDLKNGSLDLNNKHYSEETLIKNIDILDLRNILSTQKLSFDFCENYILNEKYHKCVEDTYLDTSDILKYQPHLKSVYKVNGV